MRCPEASEKITEYLDERLSWTEEASLMSHIAECAECQREWVTLSRVSAILASPVLIGPPPGFTARFEKRLVRWRMWRRLLIALPIFAVAALVLIILIAPYVGDSVVWELVTAPSLITSMLRVGLHLGSTIGSVGQVAIVLASAVASSPTVLVLVVYAAIAFVVTVVWAYLISRVYVPSPAAAARPRLGFQVQL